MILQLLSLILFALCILVCPDAPAAPAEHDRPNVVIILMDDMGFSDVGCYGSEIPTPNIDALAQNGVRFTQFYNTARCSPTRASLLTGLYPHQVGVGHLESEVHPGSKGTTGRLNNECVTIAEVLKEAGYLTCMTGKWHIGHTRGVYAWNRGFERSLVSPIGAVYFRNQDYRNDLYLNGEKKLKTDPVFPKRWYSTDLFTDFGIKFIDEAIDAKQPFFYYLPYCATHFPLMAPAKVVERYRGKYKEGWEKLREARHKRQIEMGLVDAAWPLSQIPPDVPEWDSLSEEDKDRFDHMMAIYAAMLDRVDKNVGKLVAHLKDRGELDNTLIFFLADNGGNAESGPRGIYEGKNPGGPASKVFLGQSWATLNNTPFRRYKHFTHEGGISTPLIAHWPAHIAKERNGQYERQPGHLVDLMATIVDVTGAEYPTEYNGNQIPAMEGVSLMPALAGEDLHRKNPIYWEHEGNRAIRRGKWKAVMKLGGPWELYDMEADRTEQHDVIDEQPELAKELIADWEAWAARSNVGPWPGKPRPNSGDAPQAERKPKRKQPPKA